MKDWGGISKHLKEMDFSVKKKSTKRFKYLQERHEHQLDEGRSNLKFSDKARMNIKKKKKMLIIKKIHGRPINMKKRVTDQLPEVIMDPSRRTV